jgi:SpoIID/LytB domain protein
VVGLPCLTRLRARILLVVSLLVAGAAVGVVSPPGAAAYPTANVEIDGHGFGHGRGMGQWGALGYAINFGWGYRQILDHYYSNTTVGDAGNPEVDVILRRFDNLDTVVFQERSHMTTSAAGGTFSALRAVQTGANTFRVDSGPGCGGPWTTVNPGVQGPVLFKPQTRNDDTAEMLQTCEPDGQHRWYRGDLRAVQGLSGTRTVNAVDMQGYLKGVVPRESPASWGSLGGGAGMNALRAQAVAARSYAAAAACLNPPVSYAMVDDTTNCQVYGGKALNGNDLEDPRSNQAVDDTAGEVRLLNGAVARTEFSSSTGGYTAGGTFPAVVDDGDAVSGNPHHSWHASIPVGQVQAAFPSVGTLLAVTVTSRNGLGDFGGRVLNVQVQGTGGTVNTTGGGFRDAVGLESDWFAIAAPPPPPRGPGNGPVLVRPDGVLTGAPDAAAVRGNERTDVVVKGTDGGYWWTFWTGSSWTSWAGLGAPPGGALGDPTIVSWAPGRLDVFVRGADSKLWQRFSENGGASWSAWIKPVGDDGVLASAPEASSWGPGRLDIFVVGTDGNVYQRFWDGSSWDPVWFPQGAPSAGIKGEPTTTSSDAGRVDIFVRGGDDKLWRRSWNGSSWSAWNQPVGTNGVLASPPDAASSGSGNLQVFVRGTDGGLYRLTFNGTWDSWTRLGAAETNCSDGPGATSQGAGRFDVYCRGTDNRLWEIWQ